MVGSDYSLNAGAAWELAVEIYGRWNRKRVEKQPWRKGLETQYCNSSEDGPPGFTEASGDASGPVRASKILVASSMPLSVAKLMILWK